MAVIWIEINLPFDTLDGAWFQEQLKDQGIIEPDLSEEERDIFGATREELWKKYGGLIEEVRAYENGLSEELCDRPGENWQCERFLSAWLNTHQSHQEAYDAQKLREKIYHWRQSHPAWISYHQRYDALLREEAQRTFFGQGLAKPGTLIELEDGSRHLIGTINSRKGVCDDCVAFGGETIVVRYAILVDWSVPNPLFDLKKRALTTRVAGVWINFNQTVYSQKKLIGFSPMAEGRFTPTDDSIGMAPVVVVFPRILPPCPNEDDYLDEDVFTNSLHTWEAARKDIKVNGWSWTAKPHGGKGQGHASTKELAKEAADSHLKANGWFFEDGD